MQAATRSSSGAHYYTNTKQQPTDSKDHAFNWSIGSDYPEPSAPPAPEGLFEAQTRQLLTRNNPQQKYGATSTQAQVQARQPRTSAMESSADCCSDPICCIVVPNCGPTDCCGPSDCCAPSSGDCCGPADCGSCDCGGCDCGTCAIQ